MDQTDPKSSRLHRGWTRLRYFLVPRRTNRCTGNRESIQHDWTCLKWRAGSGSRPPSPTQWDQTDPKSSRLHRGWTRLRYFLVPRRTNRCTGNRESIQHIYIYICLYIYIYIPYGSKYLPRKCLGYDLGG